MNQLWAPTVLQPMDQNEQLVPHLKDLIHICLEPEFQSHDMSFKVCNLGTHAYF